MLVPLGDGGVLPLRCLVRAHSEAWINPDDTSDTLASMATKARIARVLRVRSLSEIEESLNSLMGVPAITPDLGPFDWLRPIASFLVRMRIGFCLFTLTNAEHGITMYLAVPQRVRLHLSIERFCDLDAAEEALEGEDLTVDQDVTVPPAEELNRRLRLMYLRALLERLEADLESAPDAFGPSRRHKVRRLREEIGALRDD